jgi:AraC-like DNA-binding protein
MREDSIFYIAAGGALLLSLVLATLLLRGRGGRRLSDLLQVGILAAASLNILHALTIFPGNSLRGVVIEPIQFALPPLFAGYVKALLDPDFRLPLRRILHLLPCLLAVGVALVITFSRRLDTVAAREISIGLWAGLLLQAFLYLGSAVREIGRYREALKTEVSSLAGADPSWLRWFSWILHFIYLLYVLVPFLLLHLRSVQTVRNFISLVLSLSMCALCFRQVLGKAPAPRVPAETKRAFAPELPGLIEKVMGEERLYLQPMLDLDALTRRLGWPRNEISAAINGHFGMNFYDFVNAYRVRQVKALMASARAQQITLFGLALEAGFNSKPTFNAVFKKLTRLTPSQYARTLKKV